MASDFLYCCRLLMGLEVAVQPDGNNRMAVYGLVVGGWGGRGDSGERGIDGFLIFITGSLPKAGTVRLAGDVLSK